MRQVQYFRNVSKYLKNISENISKYLKNISENFSDVVKTVDTVFWHSWDNLIQYKPAIVNGVQISSNRSKNSD